MHTTLEGLLEGVFPSPAMTKLHKEKWKYPKQEPSSREMLGRVLAIRGHNQAMST
jgi:hypothetical protein